MESTGLIKEDRQDNTNNLCKALPYFIEIQKSESIKIKIPCSNEDVAKKILASYSNYKSNSKIPLVRD